MFVIKLNYALGVRVGESSKLTNFANFKIFILQSQPFIWCSACVVVARNARRRITPPPRRSNTSTRRSSCRSWSTTVWTTTARSIVWGASVPAKNVEPVSSWPHISIASTVANVVLPTCSMLWTKSRNKQTKHFLRWFLTRLNTILVDDVIGRETAMLRNRSLQRRSINENWFISTQNPEFEKWFDLKSKSFCKTNYLLFMKGLFANFV